MSDELNDLQSRIRDAKAAPAPVQNSGKDDSAATNTGVRAITDLIVTPVVCGAIGMGLDEWFKTKPVFFIIMAFLGVITGFWNLSRMKDGNDSSVGFKRLQSKEKTGNKSQLSGTDSDT